MRSVTFADEKVTDLLNEKFVLLWNNHSGDEAGEAGEQPAWSPEELKLYPEGGGQGNVRTYVCRPDGAIVSYVEGWFAPERILEEAAWGLSVLDAVDLKAKHAERRDAIRKAAAELAERSPEEMRKPFAQSEIRRRHAMLGLLAHTHDLSAPLAGRAVRTVLEQVGREARVRVIK
jgi:hypothetical protein